MRWFSLVSHWRSPSPPGGMQWYHLLLRATYGLATAHALLYIVSGDDSAIFRSFLSLVTLTFELRQDFCTMYLTTSLIVLRLVIRKLSYGQKHWQTNRHRWKHPPRSAMLRPWLFTHSGTFFQTQCTVLHSLHRSSCNSNTNCQCYESKNFPPPNEVIWCCLCTVGQLVQTLPEGQEVWGVTLLAGEIYLLRDKERGEVEVYVVITYCSQRCLTVPNICEFTDMTSCEHNRCVYIGDHGECVHRLDVQGAVTRWTVNDEPQGLSVNAAHNVIVTCYVVRKCTVRTVIYCGNSSSLMTSSTRGTRYRPAVVSLLYAMVTKMTQSTVCAWLVMMVVILSTHMVDGEVQTLVSTMCLFTWQLMKMSLCLLPTFSTVEWRCHQR